MNTRLIFLIFSCMIVFSCIVPASADTLTPKTVQDLLHEYNLIVTAQVLDVSNIAEKNFTSYDFKIIQYVTKPQSFQSLTAIVNSTQNSAGNTTLSTFSVGDYVQLYLTSTSNGYIISPYSFKIDKSCNFVGPDYTTFAYPYGGAAAIDFRFLNLNGSVTKPILNHELSFQTPLYNDTPMNKAYAEIIITKEGDQVPTLDEKKEFDVTPCSAPDVLWNFMLTQSGNYTVKYVQFSRTYENKIFFGNSTLTYGFTIAANGSTNKIVDTTFLSPLKQFQSGVSMINIKCGHDLVLMVKSEDGSPACVKGDTANILTERGWGYRAVWN